MMTLMKISRDLYFILMKTHNYIMGFFYLIYKSKKNIDGKYKKDFYKLHK